MGISIDPTTNRNPNAPFLRKRNVDLYKLIKIRPDRRHKYDKDTVIKAARLYLVMGNYTGVAAELGISKNAVRNWGQKDWWPVLLEEIKYLKNIELDGQYTNILEKSLKAVVERLEEGDEVVVGKEIKRKKVSARDAALISAIMFDKRQLLRGDPTQIQQQNFNVDERLGSLMETFETIARRANEKVIEGDVRKDVEKLNNVVNMPFQAHTLRENKSETILQEVEKEVPQMGQENIKDTE